MQEIAPNIYVETRYPGVNVGAIATSEGVICIDAPTCPADAQHWQTQIHQTLKSPIRYLILTDYQSERVISAQSFRTRVVAHEYSQNILRGYDTRYPASMLDSIAFRYDLTRKELNGTPVINPQISFCSRATILLGDTTVQLFHVPSATPGSLWVYLEEPKVLFTGDTLVVDQHPPLAEALPDEWLEALKALKKGKPKAELYVPGRGPLCDLSVTKAIASYIRKSQDRVCKLFRAGRPRADTTTLIPDFINAFPHPLPTNEENLEWMQRQLKVGLDHIYDECKAAETKLEE